MPSDLPRLVSLACHDLRTPLATVQGFAKTLLRMDVEPAQRERYLGMIDLASTELADLIERVALLARIDGGRYEPLLREVDSLELARAADPAAVGQGTTVRVDAEATQRALSDLQRAALRHGGVESPWQVDGARMRLDALEPEAAAIVLGEDPRELGAAVATRLLRALGGDVSVVDGRLEVVLPA